MSATRTAVDLEKRYFGRGIVVETIGPDTLGVDVVFRTGPNGRDLELQAGEANLAQDLKIALLTPTGSDVFNAAFGFDGLRVLTDGLSPTMAAEMLRLAVLKTVALDPRIERVLDVSITETSRGSRRYRVDCQIQTRLGEIVRMVVGSVEGAGT